jgi:xanthine permease XanP
MITPPLVIAGAEAGQRRYRVSGEQHVAVRLRAATILWFAHVSPSAPDLSIKGRASHPLPCIISVAGSAMAAGATAAQALGGIFGLCMAGALVVVLVSRFILRASAVITPVVTGTVVTLIGLTLIEVGMVSVGGGYGARADGSFASLQNLGLAGLVLLVILVFNTSRSPRLRMLSVVLGLLAGYIAALVLGRLNLSAMRTAPWLNVPLPFRFGVSLDFSAIPPFLFMYLITVMEAIGVLTASSSLTGQPISGPVYFKRLQGGLLADGINSLVGACLNSFPSTTFAQNNGVIQLTGVGSRYVGIFVGGILMLLGLIPAVGVVVQALPVGAGGAT